MKKINVLIWMLFMASGFLFAQTAPSDSENYIYIKDYLSDSSFPGSSKSTETVKYFDGLGRPSQIVNVKASPNGKDLVTTIPYDDYGRQSDNWLPAPMPSMNGAIQSGVNASAQSYYGTVNPFVHKNLEDSPLNRVLSQIQPGTEWQQHPVSFVYTVNQYAVKKYIATFSYSTFQSSITLAGTYAHGELFENRTNDEDGNATIEFKNKEGQVILVRKEMDAARSADTYYVYNEYDQLAYIIPPLPAVTGNVDQATLDLLCYQYKYDERDRVVEKKFPGKGWEYMVYDRQDRLVLYQDANLRKTSNALNNFGKRGWLFTKYDQYGRVVYTGFFSNSSARVAMQSAVNSMNANKENVETRSTTPFTLNGLDIYYDKKAFPTGSLTVLAVNYYDLYPAGSPSLPVQILGQDVIPDTPSNTTTKSLPVASYVKNIDDDRWTKNYSWYNNDGQIIGIHSINYLGGYTHTESKLDFTGTPLQTITKHKRLSGDTERVIKETFEYDGQNRLVLHKHQVDNYPEEILAQNTYNDISQVINKKVGGNVPSSLLQSIDYSYNARGWLTQINDPKNLGSDLFGYKINYTQVEGLETPNNDFPDLKVKPRYNGNIAEVLWKTNTNPNDNLRQYGYVYDRLNRLAGAFYQKDTNPSAKEYFEKPEYDLNGNIKRMERSTGDFGQGANLMKIDDLQYEYSGNKLISVKDNQQNSTGYPYFSTPNAIQYDNDTGEGNGNITRHMDRGISQIKYNFLNLSSSVIRNNMQMPTGSTTNYYYDASGVKLKKVYSYYKTDLLGNMANTLRYTDYLDGFQYSLEESGITCTGCPDPQPVLQFIPTAEGYYNFENNKYIYHYVDHLGNIRLSYFNNGNSIEVLEENNYYPYGLRHEGYNPTAGNSAYQYRYLGEELQETGFYDLNARFYMPDLAVFGQHDAFSEETMQPYAYGFNNPIFYKDPEGLFGRTDWYRNNQGDVTWKNSQEDYEIDDNGEELERLGKSGTYLNVNNQVTQLNANGTVTQNGLTSYVNAPLRMSPAAYGPAFSPQGTNPNFSDFDTSKTDYSLNNLPSPALWDPSAAIFQAYLDVQTARAAFRGFGRILSYEAPAVTTTTLSGRLGNAATRNQINDVVATLEGRGYTVTRGGGKFPEEYLKPIGGGRKGGSYLDITATHPKYPTLRLNTVDVYKSGLPTARELNNAARIRSQIPAGEHLLLIPKK